MTAADTQYAAASALPMRDRAIIWTGIVTISALAWLYLARMPMGAGGASGSMTMRGMIMPMAHRWSAADVRLTFLMWAVMMVAMMLPTASPMLLTYARISRSRDAGAAATRRVWSFATGYLAAWTIFSVGATALQYGLQRADIIDDALRTTPLAGAIILIAAGVYQLTPLKSACLRNCRSPLGFFMTEWRDGASGALGMGLKHGVSCVGCCWMLMAMLFVAGAMNLVWVAAITVFVLLEKVAPFGRAIAAAAGLLLLASGLAVAVSG